MIIEGCTMNPYNDCISTLLEIEFPGLVKNQVSQFEAVSHAIVGTKQHRYGPTPSPERLVTVRDVIRDAMESNKPIPVLVPVGCSKQGDYNLDIAEVMLFKQLRCLVHRVAAHYPRGLDLRIRLEDATDKILFEDMPGSVAKIDRYRTSFIRLQKILLPGTIVVPESAMIGDYNECDDYHTAVKLIYELITRGTGLGTLQALGWTGTLDQQQIDHYTVIYLQLYPERSQRWRNEALSKFLAMALIRRTHGATGHKDAITISFTGPVPNAPNTRRLYYRTLPCKYQHTHRAPWMSKGYVKIIGNVAQPALANWDSNGFIPHTVRLQSDCNSVSVDVQTDYKVVA